LSRNPIYIGMFLIYAGIGVAALSSRVLVLVLPIAIAMSYGVVAREEPYLERRFGHAYRDYKARVRRWLQSLDERIGSIRAEVAVRATIAIADAASVGPAR
jgi:protein-S-isoprenylcysteine O-methyltransferase Ste14